MPKQVARSLPAAEGAAAGAADGSVAQPAAPSAIPALADLSPVNPGGTAEGMGNAN